MEIEDFIRKFDEYLSSKFSAFIKANAEDSYKVFGGTFRHAIITPRELAGSLIVDGREVLAGRYDTTFIVCGNDLCNALIEKKPYVFHGDGTEELRTIMQHKLFRNSVYGNPNSSTGNSIEDDERFVVSRTEGYRYTHLPDGVILIFSSKIDAHCGEYAVYFNYPGQEVTFNVLSSKLYSRLTSAGAFSMDFSALYPTMMRSMSIPTSSLKNLPPQSLGGSVNHPDRFEKLQDMMEEARDSMFKEILMDYAQEALKAMTINHKIV